METTEKNYTGLSITIEQGDDLNPDRATTRDEADEYRDALKEAVETEFPGAEVEVEMHYRQSGGCKYRATWGDADIEDQPDALRAEQVIESRFWDFAQETWRNWLEEIN